MRFNRKEVEQGCIELQKVLKNMETIFNSNKEQVRKINNGEIWNGMSSDSFVEKCYDALMADQSYYDYLENVVNNIQKACVNYEKIELSVVKSIKSSLN